MTFPGRSCLLAKRLFIIPCFLLTLGPAVLIFTADGQAKEVSINVDASQITGRVSPLLAGVCIEDVNHEIYGGLYSQMIFGESFQEPPPPPAIAGFRAFGGSWAVQDGVVNINGRDGPKLVSEQAAFTDGSAGAELRFADGKNENAGLILRVKEPDKGADSFIGYEVSLDAGRQILRLARHRHDFEPIKDVPCQVPAGKWLALEAKLAGSTIQISVDGKMMLSCDDGSNALAAGTVGLRAWQGAAQYRNLWVKSKAGIEKLAFAQNKQESEVSGMWRMTRRGTANGRFALITKHPFAGEQSQEIIFDSGAGEWGLENRGLNRWGMNFLAGKIYEGRVWARAEKPTKLYAAMESADGSKIYAEEPLTVESNGWQRLDFRMTPGAADPAGRFVLKLKAPGAVTLGHVFLQPGEWGRFKGLPVRRDIADALVAQGVTVLRYGGSMVNAPGYKWKKMTGPRDQRPPYDGTWYHYSSNGWGIPDFMNFSAAAGFEYIPDFSMDEKPQDMADFMEYAKGATNTDWGRRRAADGHPLPYRLHYLELGNEERVDAAYAGKFEALAKAIWAKDKDIILVVGDFAYHQPIQNPFSFTGADSHITSLAAQQRILKFAQAHNREIWFDLHVGTDGPRPDISLAGMFSYIDALERIADGARFKVAVFELNAGNHAQKRALANALALNAIARDGRVPIVTSANGLQPDGQNDNGWDQGLLFFNPSQAWLQPPGYVTRMISKNYRPQLIRCDVEGAGNGLDVTAARSADGRMLSLQIVNVGAAVSASIKLEHFLPASPDAVVTELAGPLEETNDAEHPDHIQPRSMIWPHSFAGGEMKRTLPARSFTVINFE